MTALLAQRFPVIRLRRPHRIIMHEEHAGPSPALWGAASAVVAIGVPIFIIVGFWRGRVVQSVHFDQLRLSRLDPPSVLLLLLNPVLLHLLLLLTALLLLLFLILLTRLGRLIEQLLRRF